MTIISDILKLIADHRAHWNEEPVSIYVHPLDDPGVGVVDGIPVHLDVNCPRTPFVLGDESSRANMREWLGDELYERMCERKP